MSNEIRRESGIDPEGTVDPVAYELPIGEYVAKFTNDLEAVADEASPVSPVIESLLERIDRGEGEC